jgi:S-disulfanyl-L-cysteine oxidoreductase SoxD
MKTALPRSSNTSFVEPPDAPRGVCCTRGPFKTRALLSIPAMAAFGAVAMAQTASTGVYSKAQADQGAALYAMHCARCHGDALEGLDVAPPLTGARFLGNWTGQPIGALASRVRTSMPLDNVGVLGVADSVQITAFLLQANGYPAGTSDMPTASQGLAALTLDAPRTDGK